jgi:hypothetical protein
MFLLLLAVVLVFYALLPSNDAAAQIEHTAQKEAGLKHSSGAECRRTVG